MSDVDGGLDDLLRARAEIDEKMRRHKTAITVLFTDVVGSTSYFDRYGDTAGIAMLHRHGALAETAIGEYRGTVIKTIGDSVMAEFPGAVLAAQAAAEIQRRLLAANNELPERERIQLRIGINTGMGYRYGTDVLGDVVNLAARITKKTAPAQILVSRAVRDAVESQTSMRCNSAGSVPLDGKTGTEDLFELVWMETGEYERLKHQMAHAVAQGALACRSDNVETLVTLAGDQPSRRTLAGAAPPKLDSLMQGRFKILAELGRGGMGIVYRALDGETGEEVAIKVLPPEMAANAALNEVLKNELRLARKITHKNVTRIYEYNRDGDAAFVTMEFVQGETLRTVLERTGLSRAKAVTIAVQICEGLAEAHRKGVVHRDLKPENIMLDARGEVRVMDFGIAHSAAAGMGGGRALVGTPAYMSPEQLRGDALDARSDIYALGLVLYEMFLGQPAFARDGSPDSVMLRLHQAPPRPREIDASLPAHLEKAILKCLERSPGKRFQTAEEVQAALLGKQPAPAEAQAVSAVLPLHLVAFRRSDALLAVLAAVGLFCFFYFYDSAFPYRAVHTVDPARAREVVQQTLDRLHSDVSIGRGGPRIGFWNYVGALRTLGFEAARKRIGAGENWEYYFELVDARGQQTGFASVQPYMDQLPKLTEIGLSAHKVSAEPDDPTGTKTAVVIAREVFSKDVRAIPPVISPMGTDKMYRFRDSTRRDLPEDISISWGATGFRASRSLARDNWIWVYGEGLWDPKIAREILLACLVAIFFVRKLYRATSRFALFCGLLGVIVTLGRFVDWYEDKFELADVAWVVAMCAAGFVLTYCCLSVCEYYLQKIDGPRFAVTRNFFSLTALQGRGPAVVRGLLLGWAVAGAFVAIAALCARFWNWPLPEFFGVDPYHSTAVFVLRGFGGTLPNLGLVCLLIALPVSLLKRAGLDARLAAGATLLLWFLLGGLMGGLAIVAPLWAICLAVAVQAILLITIYLSWDLLTALGFVLTVDVWLLSYGAAQLMGPGPFMVWYLPLAAWFAVVVFGLFAYFRPHLLAARRRVADLLE